MLQFAGQSLCFVPTFQRSEALQQQDEKRRKTRARVFPHHNITTAPNCSRAIWTSHLSMIICARFQALIRLRPKFEDAIFCLFCLSPNMCDKPNSNSNSHSVSGWSMHAFLIYCHPNIPAERAAGPFVFDGNVPIARKSDAGRSVGAERTV
jgi:hypothetical protein